MSAAEKERHEEARWLGQPVTPRSEKRRVSWGSLLFQVPSVGLCRRGRCLKKPNHDGPCWPEEAR